MIRILHVVSVLDVGGMESFIMNMYRNIDRAKYQFDFLVHHQRRGVFEDEIEALGGHVYHLSLMDDFNIIKYRKDLKKLFDEHPEYKVVHGHLGSPAIWYLGEAERHGVPGRILHCHTASFSKSIKGILKHSMFQLSPMHANVRLACSTEAGIYQFHKKDFELVLNGIDVERFRYSEADRNQIRKQYHLENSFVIGHVGRFIPLKNHEFMLKLFPEVKKRIPEAKLIFLGQGETIDDIRSQVRSMGLEQDVLFMGLQKNTAPYYQAMDAFILPSQFEGLPLTGIEAQSAGLPSLFSDRISKEVQLSDAAELLPIGEENISLWADALVKIRKETHDRNKVDPRLAVYDIKANTEKMIERYQRLMVSE